MKTDYPSLHVADEYVRQRTTDPDFRVRDVGHAIAETFGPIATHLRSYGVDLALDSEANRENLARHLLAELEAAGYHVTFDGTRR